MCAFQEKNLPALSLEKDLSKSSNTYNKSTQRIQLCRKRFDVCYLLQLRGPKHQEIVDCGCIPSWAVLATWTSALSYSGITLAYEKAFQSHLSKHCVKPLITKDVGMRRLTAASTARPLHRAKLTRSFKLTLKRISPF